MLIGEGIQTAQQKRKKYIVNFLLLLLTAVLYVASFPPYNVRLAPYICLIPWLLVLSNVTSIVKSIAYVVVLNILIGLLGLYWAYDAIYREFELSNTSLAMVFFVFVCLCQPQLYFYAILRLILRNRRRQFSTLEILLLSLSYAGLDYFLPKIFKDTLGYSTSNISALRQSAALIGTYGLTALIVLANESILGLFGTSWHTRARVYLRPLWTCLIVVTILSLFGLHRLNVLSLEEAGAAFRVGVIQPNIPNDSEEITDIVSNIHRGKLLSLLLKQSYLLARENSKLNLIVWPESAYPSTFGVARDGWEKKFRHKVVRFVRRTGISLVFGGYHITGGREFGALIFVKKASWSNAIRKSVYTKRRLFPFAEYLPRMEIGDVFFWVKRKRKELSSGLRGHSFQLRDNVNGGVHALYPIICYEALDPEISINFNNKLKSIIVNASNDSSFDTRVEPYIHLSMATFRSIESGLYQIRSTNTGISAVIRPDGGVIDPIKIGVAGSNVAQIVSRKSDTFYPKVAGKLEIVFLILGALPIVVVAVVRLISKQNYY